MSTIVKKLQDLSRKRRFLISEVEKIEKITRLLLLSKATNAESDGINTYALLIYLYLISNVRNLELCNILRLLHNFHKQMTTILVLPENDLL